MNGIPTREKLEALGIAHYAWACVRPWSKHSPEMPRSVLSARCV